ncbi:MAG: AMP-binding protein [Hyphomicrobiaceae bacterium]
MTASVAKLANDPATSTLPKLLKRNAERHAGLPGMREKDHGIWKTYSWRQCYDMMRAFALGLAELGFQRGDKLSVIGDNKPRLYLAQVSAQAFGGLAVPVYQDSIATELAYVLNDAEVSVIVAEDQEQVDKIMGLRDQLPQLKWIIYEDPRGMADYDDPMLKSFDWVEAQGNAQLGQKQASFDAAMTQGGADDVAMIAYTSGTTGRPKGSMLSHRNMISSAENYLSMEDIQRGDNWLSYLPMAWVGDAMLSIAAAIIGGVTINCPESPETVQRDLRELGPHGLLAPPRIWEAILTQLQVRSADSSPLKRRVFEHYRKLAETRELLLTDGKPVPASMALGYKLGEFLVYGPIRDQLGLRNTRWCLTGGAPLGPDTFRFFRSIGVNLKQIYGATEASALVAIQTDDEADPNTVGKPVPGIDVRIAENGEVQLKGPGVFVGYFKQDEATRETLTPDGWLKTGDAGLIDPRGHLAIIDRAKDVGKISDGTPFAPQFIENKLKFSPYIREAVSFGNDKPFVSAMIAIDLQTVGNWAERKGLAYTSFMDLARKPEVAALVIEEIQKINATLPDKVQVRRMLLLQKELEADDNEITRTRKVRRGYVAEKYAPVIEALYTGGRSAEVTMDITFEDGRKTQLSTELIIHDVPAAAAAARAA